MFPVLLSIGPFQIKTISVFVFLAFFLASFILWRKGREEHYSQADIFDSFLLSSLIGSFIARITFIFFNFNLFGLNIFSWFDFSKYSGINLLAGLAGAAFFMHKNSIKKKWDEFEVSDFWVTSISLGLFIYYLGTFFDGTGYGYATNMPWGFVFPNLVEPHHPVQLYFAIFYLLLYIYLSKVEYSYRTFMWYRHGKKTAQTGFLTSVFLILVSAFSFLIAFFKPASIELFNINLDFVISILMLAVGIYLLFVRSGREISLFSKKKTAPIRTKIEDLHE